MLRKINRRKFIRKGFNSDIVYRQINVDNLSYVDRQIFTDNKLASKFLDDDLFCHMLIQRDNQIKNKLTHSSYKSSRFFIFQPSYLPMPDSNIVISKEEYYWLANTITYPCIRCNTDTISFLGNFDIRNVICGNCAEKHYLIEIKPQMYAFYHSMHEHEYSKYHQDFFKINKEHQSKVLGKLLKRQKSYYESDKEVPSITKHHFTRRLTSIQKEFDNLTSSNTKNKE